MTVLEFDAGPHVYRYDGRVVPSVTQVIAPLTDYSRIPADTLERARQQGVALHLMVELDVNGELDSVPAWQEPYFAAWEQFKREHDFSLGASEQRLYHPQMHYAGTFDLFALVDNRRTLVDLKRSLYAGRAIGLQLAGYARLWNFHNPAHAVERKHALVLRENGNYHFPQFDDRQDDAAFLACLTLAKWRAQGATT